MTIIIDIWSSGCVLAELLAGKPFFPASTSVDLLCEMAKILGTPTKEDLQEINPPFCAYSFPILPKKNLFDIFPDENAHNLVTLLSEMLVFSPSKRINSQTAVFHSVFTDLIEQFAKNDNEESQDIPPDFMNFTPEEISFFPQYEELKLIYQRKIKIP
uniref:Protein kinase gsk3 (Trinotate prediction) n=1 Tax=Myxobolus squamalis TaxID=59785 RepID=A0A6B2FXB8_MYXSQ